MATEAGDKSMHYVFRNDPINLKSFVYKFVQITTNDNTDYNGYVYTIDPVTGSYIIVKPSGTSEDKMLVEVIPGCAIQNVVIIEEPTPTLKDPTTIDKLFISTSNCMNFDPNFLPRRKLQVTQWFQKNFIPIQQCKDDPDSLIIMNSLKIMSPYGVDDCYTDNEVVLGKIQGLLKAMPPDVDDD